MPVMQPDVRDTLIGRIERLAADNPRKWGRMTAGEMVCHLSDQLRIALGDIRTQPIPGALRLPGVKHFVIYIMPWPKGLAQAPPEAQTTKPGDFVADRTALCTLLIRFAAMEGERGWPMHPRFGRMTGRLWAGLTAKHFHHHLTQFGV